MVELPTLLTCGFCAEKHQAPQCPNVDMARMLELVRCGWSFRESFFLSKVVGEQHDVEATGPDGSRQAFSRLLSADAWDAALKFASHTQARAEVSGKEKSK